MALALGVSVLAGACSSRPAGPTAPTSGRLLPPTATALPTFDPATFQRLLDQLHGRPVLVNVWASWCGDCTRDAPAVATLAREFQGRVQFVGLDIQDQTGAARVFVRRYGWTYPSVQDPAAAILTMLGYVAPPITILYDRSGRKVTSWAGPITVSKVRAALDRVA
jgi:cytochrome c biogenesis protein CcmG/thiol:disulfide interchange protein DsbE